MSFHSVMADVLSYALQSGFLLLVGVLAPRLLHLRHPRTLLAYWRILFLFVLLVPLATAFWQPRSALPILSINGIAVNEVVATALPSNAAAFDWRLLLLPVAAITFLALLRLAAGLIYLDRSRRSAVPLHPNPEGVAAIQRRLGLDVPFAVTHRLSVPVTFGWAACPAMDGDGTFVLDPTASRHR